MLMSWTLHGLFLAGTLLCVCSAPLQPPITPSTKDHSCEGQCAGTETPVVSTRATGLPSGASDADRSTYGTLEQVTDRQADLTGKLDAEGGAGLHEGGPGPEGITLVTQARNGDSYDRRSGLSDDGGEAWNQREAADAKVAFGSSTETGESRRRSVAASEFSAGSERKPGAAQDHMDDAPVTNPAMLIFSVGEKQETMALNTQRASLFGPSASPIVSTHPQPHSSVGMAWQREDPAQGINPWDEVDIRTGQPDTMSSPQGKDTEKSGSSSADSPGSSTLTRRRTPLDDSSILSSSLSPHPTLQSAWGQEAATNSMLPDPIIPDIGPELTPKQDGPESVWTEPLRQGGVDTVGPLSQDDATEGTMSSEALPLIFEPFDDVTPDGAAATLAPSSSEPLAAMATGGMLLSAANLDQLATLDTDGDGPSHVPSLLLPDWTSPWQTSGAELSEPISTSGPSLASPPVDTEKDADRIQIPKETQPTSLPSHSTVQDSVMTVTKATHRAVSKSRSGLEELESEEEPDEDEEDETTEDSDEGDSEEDLTEIPKVASTRPPCSLIPPPPIWVQRNQGLMRSWMELIREKAGYVSGMLAPVGIGIAGALLIMGALYSIRVIHRKRKNSFKHQRRKVRQPEQPREHSTNRQDQAMLLADSSEDEF